MLVRPKHHEHTSPLSWWSIYVSAGGGFAILLVVALVVMTVLSVGKYRDAARLLNEGADVTATVAQRRIDKDDSDKDYFITVQFEVGGRDVRYEREVSRSFFYTRAVVGRQIPVRYWTKDADLFDLEPGATRKKAWKYQIFALIAGVAALVGFWWTGSKAARGVLARRLGVQTTATVSGWVERKNSGRPTGKGYMMFRTLDGQKGQSLDHPIRRFQAIGVGGTITVYVRENDVWWEGDVGPRALPPPSVPRV